MSLMSYVRTRYLAWSNSTPLPDLPDCPPPVFQSWNAFDETLCKWTSFQSFQSIAREFIRPSPPASQYRTIRLVTWNIDAFGDNHESRMDGILRKLQQVATDGTGLDVIFLQEVSRKALAHLLQAAWVREHWVSSEDDETNWADVPFATVTLLSRLLLGVSSPISRAISESTYASTADAPSRSCPVWRVKYPSRFKRDALCCDLIWDKNTRVRLINVHLDSLPIQPNQRPRQVAIAASLLRTAGVGRGFIAGDWNPVLEEDTASVQENRLVDVWERLHAGEDGFTWGVDGKSEPFFPARLDKVAVLGLYPLDMQIIHSETLSALLGSENEPKAGDNCTGVQWSDHSGLFCSFVINDGKGE